MQLFLWALQLHGIFVVSPHFNDGNTIDKFMNFVKKKQKLGCDMKKVLSKVLLIGFSYCLKLIISTTSGTKCDATTDAMRNQSQAQNYF